MVGRWRRWERRGWKVKKMQKVRKGWLKGRKGGECRKGGLEGG